MTEADTNKTTTTDAAEATTTDTTRNTGTVKSFDTNKRFGFITQEDGKEVFVHEEALTDGITISSGDRVTYEVTENPKGPRAAAVRKL